MAANASAEIRMSGSSQFFFQVQRSGDQTSNQRAAIPLFFREGAKFVQYGHGKKLSIVDQQQNGTPEFRGLPHLFNDRPATSPCD